MQWTHTQLARSILIFWILGLSVELVLIGHYDGWVQYLPLIVLSVSLVSFLVIKDVSFPRIVSLITIAVGVLGIVIHFKNNVDFEIEMYPDLHGFQLIKRSLTGALPVMAPGALIPIGLLGLLFVKLKSNNK